MISDENVLASRRTEQKISEINVFYHLCYKCALPIVLK